MASFFGNHFCSKVAAVFSSHFRTQDVFHAGIETCRQMQAENEARTKLAAVLRYGSGDKDVPMASIFWGSTFCSKWLRQTSAHFSAQKHH